jgi:hypothetical protein
MWELDSITAVRGKVAKAGLTWVLFALWVGALGLLAPVARADGASREYAIKAAFIYNFAQFAEWPSEAFSDRAAPITIGVVGDDPFNGVLEHAVAGKTVGGRKFAVKHLAASDDLAACHILFVAASEQGKTDEILKKVKDGHVMTISESEQFPAAGGMIRFFTEDNKIRFEINKESAQAANLKLSSQLMRLARVYKK